LEKTLKDLKDMKENKEYGQYGFYLQWPKDKKSKAYRIQRFHDLDKKTLFLFLFQILQILHFLQQNINLRIGASYEIIGK
jgi:hypothetical protein